jgi:hypothetical protein
MATHPRPRSSALVFVADTLVHGQCVLLVNAQRLVKVAALEEDVGSTASRDGCPAIGPAGPIGRLLLKGRLKRPIQIAHVSRDMRQYKQQSRPFDRVGPLLQRPLAELHPCGKRTVVDRVR